MITVLYTCRPCKVEKEPVQVPARAHADIDIKEWVLSVGQLCGEDHRRKHPECTCDRVDLMIPYSQQGEFLGQQLE